MVKAMKEPFVWFWLGGVFLVVGLASLFGGFLETLLDLFGSRRHRRKLIDQQREKGGKNAVDRFLESEKRHEAAKIAHQKKALSDAFVGDGERWKSIAFVVAVAVLIMIALTR